MKRLEDLSADELAERFPPRPAPPARVLPPATPPTVVPRLREGAKPTVRSPRGRRPPRLVMVHRRCWSCKRAWFGTARAEGLRDGSNGWAPCPFCGASA